MIHYIVQFVVGGGTIVAVSYLATRVGTQQAAIFYALPIQFTIAAIFIYLGTAKKTVEELSFHSLYSILLMVIFILIFYFLVREFNFWISLAISYVIFLIGAYILMELI